MNQQKKVVLFTTLAIVICIIFIVISLFVIWTPEDTESKESLDGRKNVFSYVPNTNFEEKTFNLYKSEVKRLLMPINVEQLAKKLDKDYLESNSLNNDNLASYLNEQKLLSNNINFRSYSVIKNGDVYIYRVLYDTLNNIGAVESSCVINIIEQKPFEYTLSFERDSLELLKHEVSKKIDGISFNIKNIENKENSVKFEINFTNENEEGINIDFDDINNVVLVLDSGKQIRMAATVISADEEILTKGSSLKKEAFFNASLEEQGKIKAIKFNKVTIGDKQTSITVEF